MTGWKRAWPWLVGLSWFVGYELFAVFTNSAPTLSEIYWHGQVDWLPLSIVVIGGLIVLIAHLAFGLLAPEWATRWIDRLNNKGEKQ
jgi:hypothetical protein